MENTKMSENESCKSKELSAIISHAGYVRCTRKKTKQKRAHDLSGFTATSLSRYQHHLV